MDKQEDAQRCIQIAKEAFHRGDIELALRMVAKSIRIHPTEEATALQKEISAAPKTKSRPTPKSEPVEKKVAPTRDYTAEQEEAVRSMRGKIKSSYYEILGLERTCTEVEIKKSYRKLALQFHPDKNACPGADDIFKAVSKAFDVLSDPSKRRLYDMTGSEPSSSASTFTRTPFDFDGEQIDPNELFRMFFESQFAQVHTRRRTRPRRQEGSEIMTFLQLIPFILMIITTIFSAFLGAAPNTSSELGSYSFIQTDGLNIPRNTFRHSVQYYVNPYMNEYINQKLGSRSGVSEVKQFENEIEQEYYRKERRRK